MQQEQEASLNALRDIRSMMERSARFISLSGWSGVWAGTVALAGSWLARRWLRQLPAAYYNPYRSAPGTVSDGDYNAIVLRFVLLALTVFVVALIGAYYFTWRKTRVQGVTLWNSASRRMLTEMSIPLATGGIFALFFLYAGHEAYITPACLAFYGMALINGSKYTLSDIRYLGLCMVSLGCVSLFLSGHGLLFWALGFGALHMVYGIIMWFRYDKRMVKGEL